MSVKQKFRETRDNVKEKFKDPFYWTMTISGSVLVGILAVGIYKGKKYNKTLKPWTFAEIGCGLYRIEATDEEVNLYNAMLQSYDDTISKEDRHVWEMMCDRVADALREVIQDGRSKSAFNARLVRS